MPELPEVETLRRGLEQTVLHRRIIDVTVANPKVLRGQSPEQFCQRVIGSRIESVGRRGKYLSIPLSTTGQRDHPQDQPSDLYAIYLHLKMRGQILLEPADGEAGKYHCVSLVLDNGTAIRFYDMWTWGEIRALTRDEAHRLTALAAMGAEPLEEDWGGAALAEKLKGRRLAIKPTLLDQTVVAGVGNIYADESLFRAGISPLRPAGSLTEGEAERLALAIRGILTEATDGGGTTSDEYVDIAGAAGRYVPKVYDRGGAACVICGKTLTRLRLAGRGTVYCETCQH